MKPSEYVEKFRQNDYTLFDEFYKLTHKQVYFTALGILRDHGLAEDVTQDTFVTFLSRIDEFRRGANVFTYLSVIARNKSINLYNRNKRLDFDEELLKNVPHEEEIEIDDGVEGILSLLSDSESREIVVYHVILGYKFIEIAEVIGRPLGTVLWRYNKAMKTLREKVGRLL